MHEQTRSPMRAMAAVSAVGTVLFALTPAFAQSQGGDWIVDARLRYESVSQDGLRNADALTLRTRLGYETPAWRGVRALAEVEGVAQLAGDFNDTVNGDVAYAVIADPEALELNRLQLSWTGGDGRRAIAGRQRVVLGDARFVGNVGFRQNEQTFDAVRLETRPADAVVVTYLYIDRVQRIFGDDSPQGEWDSDSHVLTGEAALPLGRLNGYVLLLDFSNAPTQSSQTFGLRWSHEWEAAHLRPRFLLEAATQGDYRGNTASYDLGYQRAEFGVRADPWTINVGAERLEGDEVRGFSTPLATLHAFQGWADVFLTTPPDGVRELYAGVSYATRAWPAQQPAIFTLAAHDFSDDSGGTDFGAELDASARLALTERVWFEAKAALFNGEDPRFADRTKMWFTLEYRL